MASASELIKRFREGKPTSRQERESLRESKGNTANRMWWESDDGNDQSNHEDQPRSPLDLHAPATKPSKPPERSAVLRKVRQPADFMSSYNEGSLTQALTKSSVDSTADFGSGDHLFRERTLGQSLDVNDMIEEEIKQLELAVQDHDRKIETRLSMGSFDPSPRNSLNASLGTVDSPAGFRFGAHPQLGGTSSLRSSVNDSLGDSAFLRRSRGDKDLRRVSFRGRIPSPAPTSTARSPGRSPIRPTGFSFPRNTALDSVETLGTSGFKGLLVPELKLDGKPEKKDEVEGDVGLIGEELQKLLDSLKPGKNPYFPDNVDETIPQITNKMHAQMLEFRSLYGNKHAEEDAAEAERTARDEEMKNAGRDEQRKERLLEIDLPANHPLEYLGVWDGQQVQSLHETREKTDFFPYPVPLNRIANQPALSLDNAAPPTSPFQELESLVLSPERPSAGDMTNAAAGGETDQKNSEMKVGAEEKQDSGEQETATATGETKINIPHSANQSALAPTRIGAYIDSLYNTGSSHLPNGIGTVTATQSANDSTGKVPQPTAFPQNVGMVQAAVDVEMGAAEEVVGKMRALRSGLGNRMRHLDAMYAGLGIQPPAADRTSNFHGSGPALPVYARPYGPGANPVGNSMYPGPPPPPNNDESRNNIFHPQFASNGIPGNGVSNAIPVPTGRPGNGLPILRPNPLVPGQFISSTVQVGNLINAPGGVNNPMQWNPYWGLEDYYAYVEDQALKATEDTRKMWNPFPDLVHENILSTSKGIGAKLDSAMDVLKQRLNGESAGGNDPPLRSAVDDNQNPSTDTPPIRNVTVEEIESTPKKEVPPPPVEPVSDLDKVIKQREESIWRETIATDTVDSALAQGIMAASESRVGVGKFKPLPTRPTLPVPPSKAAAFAELDAVLGIDDSSSNYLGLDQFVPAPNRPTNYRTKLPPKHNLSNYSSNRYQSLALEEAMRRQPVMKRGPEQLPPPTNPHLNATDKFIKEQYSPLAVGAQVDPRFEYAARRHQGMHGVPSYHIDAEPKIVHAPSDYQLQQLYPNTNSPSLNVTGTPDYQPAATAPPAPRPVPEYPSDSPANRYFATAPSAPYEERKMYFDENEASLPYSIHSAVEAAAPFPLRRPAEGSAIQHVRANSEDVQPLGTLNSSSSNRTGTYVGFPPGAVGATGQLPARIGSESYRAFDAKAKEVSLEPHADGLSYRYINRSTTDINNHHNDRNPNDIRSRTKREQSATEHVARIAFGTNEASSIYEKESYLEQMRKMRHALSTL